MPGAAVWPGVIKPNSSSDVLVSSMDIFPTALAVAGVTLDANYTVDGRDMQPVLRGANTTQHEVLFHYCGFEIPAARISYEDGLWKVFWKGTHFLPCPDLTS